jgi:hypothetical protein
MKNRTLKIPIAIPEGYEVDSFDKSSCQLIVTEKLKDVFERIKTVADVLADHGLTQEDFDKACALLSLDEKAYRILKMLALSLNEGWVPDWNNDSEYKYYAWFYMGGSSGFRFLGCDYWSSRSGVGSRLCFKSRVLAEHAGKNFTAIYKQFMVIE